MTTVRKNNTRVVGDSAPPSRSTEVKNNRKPKEMPSELPPSNKTPKAKETSKVTSDKVTPPKVTTTLVTETPEPSSELLPSTRSKSKKVTPESLEFMFNEFDTYLETEIKGKKNKEEVKTLKNVRKNVKNLKLASLKLTKVKPKVVRKMNPDAGFFKPVGISQDLAKFTGWNPKETKTRVDATRYICQYIKEHNLQNPSNKREIVPDKNLSQFLKFDSSKNEPLTYSKLQTYMKPHFIKC